MFASGYVSKASTIFVVYFINEIIHACRVYIAWCKHSSEFGRIRKSLCTPEPQELSSSPKLPRVFASGYVNMPSILCVLNIAVRSMQDKSFIMLGYNSTRNNIYPNHLALQGGIKTFPDLCSLWSYCLNILKCKHCWEITANFQTN